MHKSCATHMEHAQVSGWCFNSCKKRHCWTKLIQMIKPCVHHSMIRVIESTMHMGTPGDGHRHTWDAACTWNGDQTLFQQSTMASTLLSTQSYIITYAPIKVTYQFTVTHHLVHNSCTICMEQACTSGWCFNFYNKTTWFSTTMQMIKPYAHH